MPAISADQLPAWMRCDRVSGRTPVRWAFQPHACLWTPEIRSLPSLNGSSQITGLSKTDFRVLADPRTNASLSQTTQRRVRSGGHENFQISQMNCQNSMKTRFFKFLGTDDEPTFLTTESALRSQLLQAVLSWASRKIVFRLSTSLSN